MDLCTQGLWSTQEIPAHQCMGAESSGVSGVPQAPSGPLCCSFHRQHNGHVDQKGFGLQLVEIDSKHHIYILVSNLPRLEVENLKQDDCTANLGLLTVILSFLFVKGNAAKESAVWELLRRLQVDPGVKHEVFGAVKKLVTEEFVRQKYLEYNRIPHTDPPEFEFQWGAWAAKETSKMQILRFVYTEAAAEEAAVGDIRKSGIQKLRVLGITRRN
uniref:MAGE domain-containing protein n=1 Tax=Gopherus agassizii TaxID=38772 RepID=A0A452HZ89_9SAUR